MRSICLTWPVLGEPAQPWGGSTFARRSGGGCPGGNRLVDGGGALAPLAEQVLCLGDDSEQTPQGVEQHLQRGTAGSHRLLRGGTGCLRLTCGAKACKLQLQKVLE